MSNENEVRLSSLVSPHFAPVHKAIKENAYNSIWCIGGRGSLKSSFVACQILLLLLRDPNANAIAFRKVDKTVRRSIKTTFEWAIDKMGMSHLWDSTIAPAEITFIPTGQKIVMSGLDDPKKIKSIKLRRGYFKSSWFEELDEFDGMEEIRNVGQSVMRGGDHHTQFVTFNPPRDPNHWVNKEILIHKPNRLIHRSTYLDAPREWLGDTAIQTANELKRDNPLAYDHEYLGIATGLLESVIFNGKYKIMDFDVMPEWDGPYYGADWGFAADPSVLVRAWIEDIGNGKQNLYVDYARYGYKIDTVDLPALFDDVPRAREYTIRADGARPETISHMRRAGFNCIAAPKWAGSVEDGIQVLRGFNQIIIHERNREFQEEARLYSYKVDKFTKDILPDIIDKNNHGWDALRYALAPFIQQKGGGGFIVL